MGVCVGGGGGGGMVLRKILDEYDHHTKDESNR